LRHSVSPKWCHHERDVLDGYTDRERIAAMAMVSGQADPYDLDALAVSEGSRRIHLRLCLIESASAGSV
jgi:hypothetical protein